MSLGAPLAGQSVAVTTASGTTAATSGLARRLAATLAAVPGGAITTVRRGEDAVRGEAEPSA